MNVNEKKQRRFFYKKKKRRSQPFDFPTVNIITIIVVIVMSNALGEGKSPDQRQRSDGNDQVGHGQLYVIRLAVDTVRTIHKTVRTFEHGTGKTFNSK